MILFDLDGTLVDSREDLAIAVNRALADVALPPRSLAEITSFIGEGSRRLVEKALGAEHQERFPTAFAAWEKHYAQGLLVHTSLYPGLSELLESLEAPLAIHTNKPGPFARQIVEGLGLGQRFVRVLGGGDGAAQKPSPEGALRLLAERGASAGDSTYVGDSDIDARTAQAAGLRFIGVAWGFGGEAQLRQAGATRIAADARALAALLRGQ